MIAVLRRHGRRARHVAKHLESEEKALRFTHDEWMSKRCGDDPPDEDFREYYAVLKETGRAASFLGPASFLTLGFGHRQIESELGLLWQVMAVTRFFTV